MVIGLAIKPTIRHTVLENRRPVKLHHHLVGILIFLHVTHIADLAASCREPEKGVKRELQWLLYRYLGGNGSRIAVVDISKYRKWCAGKSTY